jgi:hypothetical protein
LTGWLEAGRLRLVLAAEPAFAAVGAYFGACVGGGPGQCVDFVGSPDDAFDRTAVRRVAFGVIPRTLPPILRTRDFALPDAGLGIPSRLFLTAQLI